MSTEILEYGDDTLIDLDEMAGRATVQFGFNSNATIKLISLSENATYRVDAQDRSVIIRLHRVGYHDEASIRSELAWIDALRADDIVSTPGMIEAPDGRRLINVASSRGRPSRYAVAFDLVEGKEPETDNNLEEWFVTLGEITARLHAHARVWERPDDFTRPLWDFEAMLGKRHLWGSWRDSMGLSGEGFDIVASSVELVRQRLQAYGHEADRFGLVHADLRLANLLVDGATMRVIDFDDCGFSWFMYDFASAISFHEHEPYVPALLRAWLGGYRKAGAIRPEDEAILPTMVMARRILLTAWLASHREIPLAKQLGTAFTHTTVELCRRYLATGSPV